MLKRRVTVVLAAMLLVVAGSAHAFKFGVIGDSMSTAANTEDDCNDTVECLESLGTSNNFSFTHAPLRPWSLLNRLKAIEPKLTSAVSVARNGSRWDDAHDQAKALMRTPGIRIVHIEMGANDVCSGKLATDEELAELEAYMDLTLAHITDHMQNGAVILSEVPDVARVRDIHRTDQHFLFDTFQDLWDFDTNNLNNKDAVQEVCEYLVDESIFEFLGSHSVCNAGLEDLVGFVVEEGLEEIIDQNDAKFPCQRVLSSDSTDLDRQQARELNQAINALLAVKAQEYDGRNDNAFFLADNVEEGKYTKAEISDLDGFHLGKVGQKWLADLIWESIGDDFEVPRAGWKQVSGSVSWRGQPVCALVLANGQYRFSCSGDGSFKFWVPTNAEGKVTLFAFAGGFAPFRVSESPDVLQDMEIELSRPDGARALSVSPTSISSTEGRATISGTVTYNGIPVCALVLANGQHMFSCGDNSGSFSLDVPLNTQGGIRLFGFASGFVPFRQDF